MIRWSALAFGLSFVVACSSGSSEGGAGGTGGNSSATGGAGGGGTPATTPLAYKPCDQAARLGGVTVDLKRNPGSSSFTNIQGGVRSGPDPMEAWDEMAKEGDCRLMVGRMFVCNTPCTGEQTCAGPNMCVDQPKLQDSGTLTITGLAEAVSVMWNANAGGYYKTLSQFPPAAPEASITAKTSGGAIPALSLAGRGIEPLEFSATGLKLFRNQPLAVTWMAPAKNKSTRVFIKLDIAHHGGIAARINCDVADSGSTTIPAGLVTKLMDRGLAGFPSISLTRRTVDSTNVSGGCVDFAIASEEARDIEVDGVISCNTQPDQPTCPPNETGCKACPTGMTCGKDLRCK